MRLTNDATYQEVSKRLINDMRLTTRVYGRCEEHQIWSHAFFFYQECEDEEVQGVEEVQVHQGVEEVQVDQGVEEVQEVQRVEAQVEHGLPAAPQNPQWHDHLLEEEIPGCQSALP